MEQGIEIVLLNEDHQSHTHTNTSFQTVVSHVLGVATVCNVYGVT